MQSEIAVDAVFSLYVPAAQSVHVDSAVAVTVSLHFPCPHERQIEAEVAAAPDVL